MKNLLIVLSACLSLTACMANTESTVPDDTNAVSDGNNGEFGSWHHDEGPVGCNRVSFIQVTIDDQSFWVQVPTLCDPTPYIFKGDPEPDWEQPYNDRLDPEIREDIRESFNARFVAPSRLNIVTHQ
jgi:hypothetical protein